MLHLKKNRIVTGVARKQVEIRQLEVDWYCGNYSTITGQAAMLAGFAFTQLTTPMPDDYEPPFMLEFGYMFLTCMAIGLELSAIILSTFLSVWGPSLALRGRGGASDLHRAVDCLRDYQFLVFLYFIIGWVIFFLSSILQVWIYFKRRVAVVVTFPLSMFILAIVWYSFDITKQLRLDDRDAVAGQPPSAMHKGLGRPFPLGHHWRRLRRRPWKCLVERSPWTSRLRWLMRFGMASQAAEESPTRSTPKLDTDTPKFVCMVLASGSFVSGLLSLLQEGPVAAFTQELLVLGVFFYSFLAWRRFSRHGLGFGFGLAPRLGRSAKCGVPQEQGCEISTATATPNAQIRRRDAPQLGPDAASAVATPTTNTRQMSPQHGQRPTYANAAEQQMLRHLEQREFTRALNMYRSLERDGRDRHFSIELYTAFVQSSIRVGKVDVVERMLRNMRKSNLMPTLQFWQTTLKMLSSRKHFSACLSVHSIFGDLLPADKVVFSCLINAALEIGAHTRAAVMLDKYGKADIDSKDHVLYFRTYVNLKDVDAAEAVFRRLGSEVSTLMLNLLLLTCVNAKQPKRGLEFLRESRQAEKSLPERIVDVVSYNTVIKGFAQAGQPRECFECLHEMSASGLEPDDITFGTLLDACVADHDVGAAHEIVNLLMGSERPMDTVMCTLFIKGLVRANCLSKALDLYDEMRRREGMHPDVVTYSVLIKALVDQHELDRALRLVQDMASAGHKPDDIILTHLLEGCRHAGNHELGKQLFQEMLAAGVKPSEFTLVTMLKLHGRCGAHREAHELVASWRQRHGLQPSVIHYTCLMSGCLRTKNYDQAWAAYELMCSNGITPDATAVSTLLPGMVAAQQWDHVLELAEQAVKASTPISIPAETLNNALSQMLTAAGHGRHAERLQALMVTAGVPVTARRAKRLC